MREMKISERGIFLSQTGRAGDSQHLQSAAHCLEPLTNERGTEHEEVSFEPADDNGRSEAQ